jgi:hypothetical protein
MNKTWILLCHILKEQPGYCTHIQIREQWGYFAMQENVRLSLIFHSDAYLTRIIVKQSTTEHFTVHQKGIKKEERYGYGTAIICVRSYQNHHHISVMELGHLLTRSGLTYPEVSGFFP